jgi:hypothetical protein
VGPSGQRAQKHQNQKHNQNGAKHCSSPFLNKADHRQSLKTKKADVAEHPQAFGHVGLLFNEPPGTAGLLFI